jgi:hypothetical protein
VFAFTFDDAYYYFGIARNLSDGRGSTFDQVNATNGYHPLWMAISVVPFTLGLDDLDAARALLVLQLVLWGAALAIVGATVAATVDGGKPLGRDRHAVTAVLAIVFGLVVANPFIVKAFVNGLESGVAVTLYALLLLVAARTTDWLGQSVRWRLGMSALLALVFLARTDAVFLFVCLGLWCLGDVARGRDGRAPVAARIGSLTTIFALPAVTVAAYLALNNAAFGTPVQVSGLVKRASFDVSTLGPFLLFALVAALVASHGFRRTHGTRARRPSRFPLAGAFALRTAWFAAFCLVIVGYYNLLQTQQWLWYYCPVLLYLIVLLLLAVADIITVAATGGTAGSSRKPERSAARTFGPVLAVFAIPLALGFVIETQAFVDPTLLSIQQANRDAGAWMNDNLPDDAVVASWDAGVVGYFSHGKVVNIDGVVNSVEYYRSMGDGTYLAFLRCEHVGYVVNHGADIDGRDPDIDNLLRDLYGADVARRSAVIERVPFTYSGTTNTGGFELGGTHELAVHVYEVPAEARGPRPADRCP